MFFYFAKCFPHHVKNAYVTFLRILFLVIHIDMKKAMISKCNVYEDHNLVFAGNTTNYINRHTASSRLASIKKEQTMNLYLFTSYVTLMRLYY